MSTISSESDVDVVFWVEFELRTGCVPIVRVYRISNPSSVRHSAV